ncbi:MAG: sigma-54-dependent Fis family transcriptional regulator [Xanthomonadaceae bacterium]|nr:sigma-54-dependent Fis family transcriptional regulator [Xanthomonadaceae bacterium]
MTNILGESTAVNNLIKIINQVSGSKINILIIGESGTGKELVAKMIHETGPLKNEPFIPVNCGAIPENLIESELFGHKKGSFTGATSDKPGLFEVASGGTLFLDEVGELPLTMQVKLLRALQERTIRKVGGVDTIKVDARIIAATNRNLEEAVKKGTFREDLYYRLNVVLIKTPPLRDRENDIDILAKAFLKKFNDKQGKKLKGFHPEVMRTYYKYQWPGNIREFENILERAVTLENSDVITASTFPISLMKVYQELGPESADVNAPKIKNLPAMPPVHFGEGHIELTKLLKSIEGVYSESALALTGGDIARAAEWVGDSVKDFQKRMTSLGLKTGQKSSDHLKSQDKKSKKTNQHQSANKKSRK